MLARQIAIGFGIAVIFPLLIYYGVATFHSPPKSPEINAAVVIAPGPNATADEKQNYQEQERARQRDYREKQQAIPPLPGSFHVISFLFLPHWGSPPS
jgi:hypothetical protein